MDDDEQDREDKASDQDFLRGVSGPSWNPLGAFGARLEAIWRRIGAIVALVGASM